MQRGFLCNRIVHLNVLHSGMGFVLVADGKSVLGLGAEGRMSAINTSAIIGGRVRSRCRLADFIQMKPNISHRMRNCSTRIFCQRVDAGNGREMSASVANYIRDIEAKTVALGTGVLVNTFLRDVSTLSLPSSVAMIAEDPITASEAALHGVKLSPLGSHVDLFIDEAVELESGSDGIAYIVARGVNGPQAGLPCLLRHKRMMDASTQCLVLTSHTVEYLGGSLPVLIDEGDWEETAEEIDDIFLGDAEVSRRSYEEGASPRGGDTPYITAEGNMILDITFYDGLKLYGERAEYSKIVEEIMHVPGVQAVGLVVKQASQAASVAVMTEQDGLQIIGLST